MDEHKPENSIAPKNQELVSFFSKDAGFVFAYKKTEKLVAAAYMVTNLFPENEPMKVSLRKKAGELLSFILNYKDIKGSALSDYVYTVKTQVLEIVSLLEVAMLGGLVSNMNFTVLKTEFMNLLEVLDAGVAAQKESVESPISSAFFEVPADLAKQTSTQSSRIMLPQAQGVSHESVKDDHKSHGADELKRTNRQNVILSIIRKKKEVTIKDIAHVIKDCSEKTIQRELIAFMEAGVLKRIGERRWSKYSLA
jgi:hypothetical protein